MIASASRRRLAFIAVLATASTTLLGVTAACNLTEGLQGGAPDVDGGGGPDQISPQGSCDADLLRSADNCGACGHACPSGPNSVAACFDGGCAIVCQGTFGDCDQDASTGCETNLTTSKTSCGKCGHDCLGGPCAASACQPYLLAVGTDVPAQIVSDDQNIYGVNAFGTVTRIRKDAGVSPNPVGILVNVSPSATAQDPPGRIALANSTLYWTTSDVVDGGPEGGVLEAPLDGGVRSGPVVVLSPATRPLAITVTSTTAFWSERLTDAPSPTATVKSCKLASCTKGVTVVPTETGEITSIATQGGSLYWANGGTSPAFADSAVRSCAYAACTPMDFGTTPSQPFAVVTDSATAYWTARGAVSSCIVGGCGNAPFVVDNFQFNPGFVFDIGTFLFFTTRDGAIKSVPKVGPAAAERILYQSRGTYPWDIVVDQEAVYWTDLSGRAGAPSGPALYKIAR